MKRPPAVSGGLRVVLFGGPDVQRDSREVPLSPHQRAAVGIVYGHGPAGVSRDQLIWLLWEADADTPSRHRLSQLLYAANRRVRAPRLFVVSGDHLLPNLLEVECDLAQIGTHFEGGRYLEAATLVECGLLSRLAHTSRAYDDWRDARALAVRATVRDAAAAAWSEAEGGADWERARDAAEALFKLDPESEPYLRCVMKARVMTDAAEAAEAAFRAWLEKCPGPQSPESRPRLILQGELDRWIAGASTIPLGRVEPDPPMVGRRSELRRLISQVRSATSGSITTILISGEPGIGKTRLVTELSRRCHLEGIPTLRARCGRLEQQIPLTPFVDALRSSRTQEAANQLDEPWRGAIRSILPELTSERPDNPEIDPGKASRRLFEALRRLLMALAKEKVILWLDDVQWADHTTATALEYCRRRWDGGSLILVLSFRNPSEGTDWAVTHLLSGCRSASNELALEPISDGETLAIASTVIGRSIAKSNEARFLALTDNIPLYAVELAHEVAQGRFALDQRPSHSQPLSIAIQGIVDDRIELLTPQERGALELIALGNALATPILATLLEGMQATDDNENGAETARALDRLLSLRLISDDAGVIRCKHELIRQGVCERISKPRRAWLHRRLAAAFRATSEDKFLDEIALHSDQGFVADQAFDFADRAAARALETGAHTEAIRFLQIARHNAPSRAKGNQMLEREAIIHYKQGEFDKAIPLLCLMERELRVEGRLAAALLWGVRHIHAACEAGGLDYTDSVERLDELLREAENHGFWEQYVEGVECRLRILERQNQVPGMAATIAMLNRIPSNDPRTRCLTQCVRALSMALGDGTGALQAAEEAYRLVKAVPLTDLHDKVLHRLLFAHVYGGTMNICGGQELLSEGLRRAARSDSLKTRYGFLEAAGLWHLESGEYSRAEEFFAQAEDVMRSAPEVSDKVQMLGNRAEQFVMEGRLEVAMDYYLRARAAMLPQHAWRARQTVLGGLGYCALELGELRLARDCEAELEYTDEVYFDPILIVYFKAATQRRRGNPAAAAAYVSSIAHSVDGRLRMLGIKLRLLECRLRLSTDRTRAETAATWVVRQAEELLLPARLAEARSLLRQCQGGRAQLRFSEV